MSQISDDARKMRDYIIEHGWCQGRGLDDEGRVCIIGAQYKIGADNRVRTAIRKFVTPETGPIGFNDTPGRTKQEVLDMLENVAIKYDDDAYTSGVNDDTV